MNDVLRLLRKFLRRYGYDVKKYYQYNLLPIKNQEQFNQLNVFANTQETEMLKEQQDSFESLDVCLRTCLRDSNKKASIPRIGGLEHPEIVMHCIRSLVNSINESIKLGLGIKINLMVFDDHSDDIFLKRLNNIFDKVKCDWQIKTNHEYGQGPSLLEHFSFARNKNGLFYFCEDDYLHEDTAIYEMVNFYKQIYKVCDTHLIIHPQEHELIYSQFSHPSYILLGENRRWRTISHATHTFFTHSNIVSKYWQYFENTKYMGTKKRHIAAESKTTNLLFNHVPGFSPIPALAAHMQTEGVLPPFFDWHELWGKTNN